MKRFFLLLFVISLSTNIIAGTVNVRVGKITQNVIYDSYIATANASKAHGQDISAQISGKITYINKKLSVKKDEIILTIDNDVALNALSAASSALSLASQKLQRDKELYHNKIISKFQLERAQADYDFASHKYAEAEKLHSNMIIKAPMDGEASVVPYNIGDYIAKGDYLYSFTSNSPIYKTILHLPEKLFDKISKADSKIEFMNSKDLAHIGAVSKNLSTTTGNFNIAILINDTKGQVINGKFYDFKILFDHHQALLAPLSSIMRDDQGSYIYHVVEGKVQKIYISLGIIFGDNIEVKSPKIKEGDEVIIEGLNKVQKGTSVNIMQE